MKSRHSGKADVPPDYDPAKYERPSVTADVALFIVRKKRLEALLIRRKHKPCAGMWAMPGGFVEMNESLDAAALRELKEETGLDGIYIEQLRAYGDPDRDPRARVITIAYLGLAAFERIKPRSGDDAAEVKWHSAYAPPKLAFDHERILEDALSALRKRILETPAAFELLPEYFSMADLRDVFEAVLQKPVDIRTIKSRLNKWGALKSLRAPGEKAVKYKFVT